MSKLVFSNNALGVVDSPVSVSDTTVVLSPGHGARFPSPATGEGFYATLQHNTTMEIVFVAGRIGDTLYVNRGQEGTSVSSFPSGATLELRLTAAVLDSFAQTSGATFYGDVKIQRASPSLLLDATGGVQERTVLGSTGGSPRWRLDLGDNSPESGANSGSSFRLLAYNDSGGLLGNVMRADRSTRRVSFFAPVVLEAGPSESNHAATRAYVDASSSAAPSAATSVIYPPGLVGGTGDMSLTYTAYFDVTLPDRAAAVHITGWANGANEDSNPDPNSCDFIAELYSSTNTLISTTFIGVGLAGPGGSASYWTAPLGGVLACPDQTGMFLRFAARKVADRGPFRLWEYRPSLMVIRRM